MSSKQDRRMAAIGSLCGIILLLVLVGDRLSETIKLLTVALSLQSIAGLFIHSGLRVSKTDRRYQVSYTICTVISGLILVSIILLEQRYGASPPKLFGMEAATTLLVLGITLWPFSLVTLWVLGFYRIVLPPETRAKLEDKSASL